MDLIFDIGGSFTRCAGVVEGKIVRKEKSQTPKAFREGVSVCERLAKAVLSGERAERVVAGIAGTLQGGKKKIYAIPQLPLWNGENFSKALEEILGVPVLLRNDAELAGLGEAVCGAGRGKKIVAYITVGTSVGGVRIVSEAVDENARGFEPGHQILFAQGTKKKLFEMVSGAEIENETGKKPSDIVDENFWKEQSELLAIGIANAVLFWSPDIVVLGGSVGKKMNTKRIEEKVREYLGEIFEEFPKVVFAELGDDSGLLGGVVLIDGNRGKGDAENIV